MLTVTYHISSGDKSAFGTIYDMATTVVLPPWLAELREPDYSAPTEMWSPILGDSEHVVHVTGTVSYWNGDAGFIQQLLDDAQVSREEQDYFLRLVEENPKAHWIVRVESRCHKRVSCRDPEYQKQLADTIDGSD